MTTRWAGRIMEIRCSLGLAVRVVAFALMAGAALGGAATGCASAQASADRGLIIGGESSAAPPAR
jgi:hypothetical protein